MIPWRFYLLSAPASPVQVIPTSVCAQRKNRGSFGRPVLPEPPGFIPAEIFDNMLHRYFVRMTSSVDGQNQLPADQLFCLAGRRLDTAAAPPRSAPSSGRPVAWRVVSRSLGFVHRTLCWNDSGPSSRISKQSQTKSSPNFFYASPSVFFLNDRMGSGGNGNCRITPAVPQWPPVMRLNPTARGITNSAVNMPALGMRGWGTAGFGHRRWPLSSWQAESPSEWRAVFSGPGKAGSKL